MLPFRLNMPADVSVIVVRAPNPALAGAGSGSAPW
jgi:hypothetical protein